MDLSNDLLTGIIFRFKIGRMETYTACAHCRVVLKHHDYPNGHRSDYWECESGCGAIFVPENTDQAGRRLRDWFAGMALQGIIADWGEAKFDPPVFAARAYLIANAMLAERNK